MPDVALIDEERIDEQHSARTEPFEHGRQQLPVEKIDAYDVVERSDSEARTIEIDLHQIHGSTLQPDLLEASTGNVRCNHLVAKLREEQSISAGARRYVECSPGTEKRRILGQKRSGDGEGGRMMAVGVFPTVAVVQGHGRFSEGARERER